MTTAPFDTLRLARALRDANFSIEQAEGAAYAIAEAVQTDLATKSDLREMELRLLTGMRELEVRIGGLDMRFDGLELRLDGKMAALGAELRAETAALGAELRAETAALGAGLRAEIAATKADIIKWMFGTIGFQTLVILGAVVTLMRVVRP